jgi:hypothetical protein
MLMVAISRKVNVVGIAIVDVDGVDISNVDIDGISTRCYRQCIDV